jgi:hypoxanthine phosphoribosyltransferase
MTTSVKKTYTWDYVTTACKDLAEKITRAKVEPKYIIGVSRGGLIPATLLAKELGVREVYSFGVRSYSDGIDFESRRAEPTVYQDIKHCYQLCRDNNILIVDDITDKGNTFKFITNYLLDMSAALPRRVSTVTLFRKEQSSYKPSFTHACVDDNEWVIFPWER